jgi:hypothetical protein
MDEIRIMSSFAANQKPENRSKWSGRKEAIREFRARPLFDVVQVLFAPA